MSGKKKGASKTTGKQASTGASVSEEPFALVLYDSDKTKGVVETKQIQKKDRKVGGKCKAPNPCDIVLSQQIIRRDKFDAFIVQFGSDIDFLYSLPPRKDGTIANGTEQDESFAEKRTVKAVLDEQNASKKDNLWISDVSVLLKPKIVCSLNSSGSTTPSGTIENSTRESDDTQGSGRKNEDKNGDQSPEMETPKDSPAVKTPAETDKSAEQTNNPVFEIIESWQCPTDGFQSSPSKIAFLAQFCDAVSKHRTCTSSSTTSNGNKENVNPVNRLIVIEDEDPNAGEDLPYLECFSDGPGKTEIIRGSNVYLHLGDYASLPRIDPTTTKRPSVRVNQTQATAVGLRAFVNKVTDFLTTKQEQHRFTKPAAVPKRLAKAVRDCVNRRLSGFENYKQTTEVIQFWISEHCRNEMRDREQEKTKRRFKEANNIPIQRRSKKAKLSPAEDQQH